MILPILLWSFQSGAQLLFEENFDGTVLKGAYWNFELGDGCPSLCGWGNNERQIYTEKNVRVENGSLYESGRITTKNKVEFQYGTIEVRAKLPVGRGLWPAIWMLGNDSDTNTWPDCGEIIKAN